MDIFLLAYLDTSVFGGWRLCILAPDFDVNNPVESLKKTERIWTSRGLLSSEHHFRDERLPAVFRARKISDILGLNRGCMSDIAQEIAEIYPFNNDELTFDGKKSGLVKIFYDGLNPF